MTPDEIAARRAILLPTYVQATENARANLRAELLGAARPKVVAKLAGAALTVSMALDAIIDLEVVNDGASPAAR